MADDYWGGGGGSAPGPVPKKTSWWEGIKTVPKFYSDIYSSLYVHPLATAKSLWGELKDFGEPVGDTPEQRAESMQYTGSGKYAPKHIWDIPKAAEEFKHFKGYRDLPFIHLISLGSEQGRQSVKADPGAAVLEVAMLALPWLKAAAARPGAGALTKAAAGLGHVAAGAPLGALENTRLSPLATPLRSGVEAVARTGPGAKLAESLRPARVAVANQVETAKSWLPTTRSGISGRILGSAARQIESEVRTRTGPAAEILSQLSDTERAQLGSHLAQGRRPSEPRLASAFDTYAERQSVLAAEKLAREIPAKVQDLIREQIAAKVRSKFYRVIGQSKTEQMLDAYMSDAVNPIPDEAKAWSAIRRVGKDTFERQTAKWRIYEHPAVEGEVLSAEQADRLRRAQGAVEKARGAPLEEIADYQTRAAKRQAEIDRYTRQRDQAASVLDGLSARLNGIRDLIDRGATLSPARQARLEKAVAAAERQWGLQTERLRKAMTQLERINAFKPLREPVAGTPEQVAKAQAAYEALVGKVVPARYRPALEEFDRAKMLLRERLSLEKGFGQKAYREAVADLEASLDHSWEQLRQRGLEPVAVGLPDELPVYQHREAKRTPFEQQPETLAFKMSTKAPGSLKTGQRLPVGYHNEPVAMWLKDQRDLVTQQITAETVADVYHATGGKPYEQALEEILESGFSPQQAEKLVAARYRSVHLSSYTDEAGRPHITGKPAPGELLVHRDVANALEHYFTPRQRGTLGKVLLGFWVIPVLYLAPAFHTYNILGGAILTAAKEPQLLVHPKRLAGELAAGWRMVRDGTMPTRIPTSMVNDPILRQTWNPETAVREGQSLARLIIRSPIKLAEASKRLNDLFDGMYRSVVYLEELRKAGKKGITGPAAEARAVEAAAKVLQDWDTISPIEREVFQRIIPFWSWKRTMLSFFWRQQRDHPAALLALHAITKPYVDRQESKGLPDDFDNLLPWGGKKPDGSQAYISLRGVNPFADTSDLLRLSGFLGSVHPGIQAGLRILGIDPRLGGVPAFTDHTESLEIDPATGRLRRRADWTELSNVIPQLSAVLQAVGAVKGVPAPTDVTQSGWMTWARRYWSKLRLPFPPTQRNVELARQVYLRNLQRAETSRLQAEAAKLAEQQPAKVSGGDGYFG